MSEFLVSIPARSVDPAFEKIEVAGKAGYRRSAWNDDHDPFEPGDPGRAELRDRRRGFEGRASSHRTAGSPRRGWNISESRRLSAPDGPGGRARKPCIVASPPQQVVDRNHAAARFAELLEIGGDRRLAFHGAGFVDGVKNVSALGDCVGNRESPATVVADVFTIRGGGSVDDLLQLPGDRLACFHINDLPAEPHPLTQKDEDRVMVGDGIADLPRVIANLRAIGYQGPLSLELFNRSLWSQDPLQVVQRGLDRIRALVGVSPP